MKKFMTVILAVACAVVFSACNSPMSQQKEIYTLKWVFPGREINKNSEKIYRKVNDIIQQVYPEIEVDFEMINFNEYKTRVEMYTASKEKMDLIWGNDNILPYYERIYLGGECLYLDEVITKNDGILEKTLTDISADVIEETKYNDKLFYLPNAPGASGLVPYLKIPYEYKEYFDVETLNELLDGGKKGGERLYSLIDLYLNKVKLLEDNTKIDVDYYSLIDVLPRIGYKTITSTYDLLGYEIYNSDNMDLTYLKNTKEYKDFLEYSKKWQTEGMIPGDINIIHENHTLYGGDYLLDAGWGYFENGHFYSAFNDLYIEPSNYYYIPLGNVFYTDNTSRQSSTYINSNTEYKEQAIKVLELFYLNPELYQILTYGIENENFSVNDGVIKRNDYLTYGNIFPHSKDQYYEIADSNVGNFNITEKECQCDDMHLIDEDVFYWVNVFNDELIYSEREMKTYQNDFNYMTEFMK